MNDHRAPHGPEPAGGPHHGGHGDPGGYGPGHGDPGPGPGPGTSPSLEKHPPAEPGTLPGEPGPGDPPDHTPHGEEMGSRRAATTARYEPEPSDGGRPAGRFWSVRRLPAGAVALVLLAACGLLLFDVVAVRADRRAAAWRTELADQLATRTLDDPWVIAVAAVLVLAGVWLLLFALTPGLRGLLPMRRESDLLRPSIERNAAAQVIRDRAMDISGVQAVRVRVGRSRVRVAARAHFRDLDEVRSDLDAVLDHTVRELSLARPPSLSVQVRRPGSKG
nr:DUF6286 domain-containing protein [Streptomyces otsuchiensis]